MNQNCDDKVNHPLHYNIGQIECIDAIECALDTAGAMEFCRGNVIKYLWRANRKEDARTDFKKAQWYMNKLVELSEKE